MASRVAESTTPQGTGMKPDAPKYPRHEPEISTKYAEICQKISRNMPDICPKHTRNIHETSAKYPRNKFAIPKYPRTFQESCPKYA